MSSCGTGCEARTQPAAPGGPRVAVVPPSGAERCPTRCVSRAGEKVVAALGRMHLQKSQGFGHPYALRGLAVDAFCPVPRPCPRAGTAKPSRCPRRRVAVPGTSPSVFPASPPGAEAKACLIHNNPSVDKPGPCESS